MLAAQLTNGVVQNLPETKTFSQTNLYHLLHLRQICTTKLNPLCFTLCNAMWALPWPERWFSWRLTQTPGERHIFSNDKSTTVEMTWVTHIFKWQECHNGIATCLQTNFICVTLSWNSTTCVQITSVSQNFPDEFNNKVCNSIKSLYVGHWSQN